MARKEELKGLKEYLSRELSKSYSRDLTTFEPHEHLKIDEKTHSGDITRNVYYNTGDHLSGFVGYVSFFKKREKGQDPYAVCIADGEGITYHKKASVAANKFSARCVNKLQDIIWDQEHAPVEKVVSKFNPELFKDLDRHIEGI